MIEIILSILVFIMGAFFGSFFTLAVYRIPLKEDITHKHSFCPNCKHKLGTLDLIPIFSYIFLGGKCRYCKQKIKPRYCILEILSGITLLLFTLSLKINIYDIEILKIVLLGFSVLYFCSLFIIAGIDKERIQIQKSVLVFNSIIATVYMIYLCIVDNINIYRYVIYLFVMLILFLVNYIYKRKKNKESYCIESIILAITMAIFTGESVFLLTVIYTLLAIVLFTILNKIFNKKQNKINLPIGFFLCVTNIILYIIINFFVNYIK